MTSILPASFAATVLLALGAGSALASPAVLLSDTELHQNPGSDQPVVRTLAAGTHVDVQSCSAARWCLIDRRGKTGWVPFDQLDLYPGLDDVSTPTEAAAAAAARGQGGGTAATDRDRRVAASSGGPGVGDPGTARDRQSQQGEGSSPVSPAATGRDRQSQQGPGTEDIMGKAALGY